MISAITIFSKGIVCAPQSENRHFAFQTLKAGETMHFPLSLLFAPAR
jgi:hypothetical protein